MTERIVVDRCVDHCRSCGTGLSRLFVDLGQSPISNALRRPDQADEPEAFYPLRAYVCDACRLVQIHDVASRETHFNGDYAYFSSFSDSWLAHAAAYARTMIDRLELDRRSRVVEVASNDGYLLRYFKDAGVPVLGIDPAANCAEVAEQRHGVPTRVRFFGVETAMDLAREGLSADLIVANNVLAHVPDLNDFVAGFPILLKPEGVLTIEFPHLLQMMENNYFDTIYHEHYSYLSLLAVERLLARHGLAVFDVDVLTTHGGSLRVHIGRVAAGRPPSGRLLAFRAREAQAGLAGAAAYDAFAARACATKRAFLKLLIALKDEGASIAAYGAPAKGATLLNYCGVGRDFIDYTVDRNPRKQGCAMPGVDIPVHSPERIFETRPDYLVILPWNLKDEIMAQMSGIRAWGGRFVTPLPEPAILE